MDHKKHYAFRKDDFIRMLQPALSPEQLGSGVLDDLWKDFKKVGKQVLLPAVVNYGKQQAPKLIDNLAGRINSKLGGGVKLPGRGYAEMEGAQVQGEGVLLPGRGLNRDELEAYLAPHVTEEMIGNGFFDTLWSGIKGLTNIASQVALPVASQILAKRLGGGMDDMEKKSQTPYH